MLQEFEDEFFYEEDKLKSKQNQAEEKPNEDKKLLKEEKSGTNDKNDGNDKDQDESTPFLNNEQLPEAELYDGICGEVRGHRGSPSMSSYYTYEVRQMQNFEALERDRLGMTVSAGSVTIKKDDGNMIGISIGGGPPFCPCLYIVQVFDGTPSAKEGTLESGDELLGINGVSVKGKTKVEVAKMIQGAEKEVKIHYNKLHADPTQGESLDISLKKVKHRLVEKMSSNMADNLGLSRAILCNDSLVMRLKDLQATENVYKGLVDHAKRMLKAYFDLLLVYKSLGDQFAEISVREPLPRASEVFRLFGEFHRGLEKDGIKMIKSLKPVVADFGTYLNKAIPDTKLTVRKYLDAKFLYLSYCLKCKEMDDEEHSYMALQEPLYRVETGNYEYRLILRCRQEARAKFAKLRNDVLEKIELLEGKHIRDLSGQLERFIKGLLDYNKESLDKFNNIRNIFPIEIDLKPDAFQYNIRPTFNADGEVIDGTTGQTLNTNSSSVEQGSEAKEHSNTKQNSTENNSLHDIAASLLPELEQLTINSDDSKAEENTTDLLIELGLTDVDLNVSPPASSKSITEFTDFFDFSTFKPIENSKDITENAKNNTNTISNTGSNPVTNTDTITISNTNPDNKPKTPVKAQIAIVAPPTGLTQLEKDLFNAPMTADLLSGDLLGMDGLQSTEPGANSSLLLPGLSNN